MNDKVTKFIVNIYGSNYTIKGDIDQEYIKKLADYVDNNMREIADQTKMASTQRLAVLTALYIADELFQAKDKKSNADFSEINKSLKDIIRKIDIDLEI